MSEQPTPKPWNSTKPYDEYTDIESVFLWAYDEAFSERVAVVERAWAELCALRTRLAALERVAKAAEAWNSDSLQAPQLRAAIDAAKETQCESH